MSTHDESRRDFVKKAAYVAPAILSLQAYSSMAKAGSVNSSETSGGHSEPQGPKEKKKKKKKKKN